MNGAGQTEARRSLWRWWALSLIIGGGILLALAGAYYGYVRYSDSRYSSLASTGQPPPAGNSRPAVLPTQQPTEEPTPTSGLSPTPSPVPSQETNTPAVTPQPTNTPLPPSPAVRIVIPIIDLDTKVVEVNWSEVAKFAVGHYPSADPGQQGNIVLAGHLRSDLLNEGDVFHRLPEIGQYVPTMQYTPDGEDIHPPADPKPVDIYLYGQNGIQYHYQASEAIIIKQDQPGNTWVLDPTPDQTLTLITCIPQFVYDFRFVVRAEPVG